MIGLLSGPSGVLTADEVVARRHAVPLEPASAQPAPIDAVHAVEHIVESDDAGARHAHQQELTTDERLRQDEALHAAPPETPEAEVSIDTSSEPNPDKTIDKMRQVRREALSPSDPSSQNQSIAAKAARVIRAAEAEIAARRTETLRQTAIELARTRDAAIVDPGEREAEQDQGASLGDAPPPAAHQVSEYQRQAVMSAGSRLSSIPPPPAGFDSSV